MTHELHLGPYLGRDPDLADVVGGVLCNPMTQPRASLVALATAMDFLRDPDGYDAAGRVGRAHRRSSAATAPSRSRVLARACADGPLDRARHARRSPRLVDALEAALARARTGSTPRADARGRAPRAARDLPKTLPGRRRRPLGGRGRALGARPRRARRRPGWPPCA